MRRKLNASVVDDVQKRVSSVNSVHSFPSWEEVEQAPFWKYSNMQMEELSYLRAYELKWAS